MKKQQQPLLLRFLLCLFNIFVTAGRDTSRSCARPLCATAAIESSLFFAPFSVKSQSVETDYCDLTSLYIFDVLFSLSFFLMARSHVPLTIA